MPEGEKNSKSLLYVKVIASINLQILYILYISGVARNITRGCSLSFFTKNPKYFAHKMIKSILSST